MTLEQQLTFAELSGNKTKAKQIRSTIATMQFVKAQERKDLARWKEDLRKRAVKF